jgi:hypothetical protein
MAVSTQMQRVPALRAQGLSLQGDLALASGNTDRAVQSFKDLASVNQSRSTRLRLDRAVRERATR